VPPNYGHLTVNYGGEPLVFEAFMAEKLAPATIPYRDRRGGAIYCLATASGPQVVPNPNYHALPKVREVAPLSWSISTGANDAFYDAIVGQLDDFAWLYEPRTFDATRIEQVLSHISLRGYRP